MKLTKETLKRIIIEVINEGWEETSWRLEDGEKVTIGEIIKYLGDKTIDVDPVDVRNQVLKSRGKEQLPTRGQERVDAADLSFPIIVTKLKGQYTQVLDGNHRLQKAFELKKPLMAKVLDLDNPKTPEKYRQLFA